MLKRKILKAEEGQKIFKYLLRISDASKIFLHKLFRKGKILVNGKKVIKDYSIKENDEIFCEELFEVKKEENVSYEIPDIIYSDKNILVIDKKGGEVVYGEESSILAKIKNYNKYDFIVPVHRLDKYTEGILIFALNYKTSVLLTELFKSNRVNKFYQTLLHGVIDREIFIEAEINRKESFSEVRDLCIYNHIPNKEEWILTKKDKSGTILRPIKIFDKFTLCNVEILTGHHHQIRSVCSKIGHPVAGDKKYGAIDNFKHYLLLCKKIEIQELNYLFESKKRIRVF